MMSYNLVMMSLQSVAEQISRLVQSVRTSMNNPDSASAQLGLINASQAMIPVRWDHMIQTSVYLITLIANRKDGRCC